MVSSINLNNIIETLFVGFNISFTVDSCPSKYPSATCSGRGSCDVETGTCDCDNDIKGPACEVLACPDNCGSSSQERRGRCNKVWDKREIGLLGFTTP